MTQKTFANRAASSAHALGAAAITIASWMAAPGAHAQAPFPDPKQAADALVTAVDNRDNAALERVLGADWRKLFPPEPLRSACAYSRCAST
jgi:DUF2950 family protein